jgi:hypothetical protein
VVKAKELFTLFIPDTGIDEDFSIAGFNQEASHRPITKVILIGRHPFLPQNFGYNAKHCPAIQFEITGIYDVYFHDQKS